MLEKFNPGPKIQRLLDKAAERILANRTRGWELRTSYSEFMIQNTSVYFEGFNIAGRLKGQDLFLNGQICRGPSDRWHWRRVLDEYQSKGFRAFALAVCEPDKFYLAKKVAGLSIKEASKGGLKLSPAQAEREWRLYYPILVLRRAQVINNINTTGAWADQLKE